MRDMQKAIFRSNSRGYTLVEAAVVVAITAVMVSVVVPIISSEINKAKSTSATNSCQTLATTISQFYSNTNEWPNAIKLPRHNPINDSNSFQVLRSGVNEGDENLDPNLDKSSEVQLWKVASGKVGNINDHLLTDKIGYGDAGIRWKGPYINQIDQDPFGRNYLIYIRASYHKEESGKYLYLWVISAGPNKKIETAPTDDELHGDDSGALIMVNPPEQVVSTVNSNSNGG